jgi:hypothetical protein
VEVRSNRDCDTSRHRYTCRARAKSDSKLCSKVTVALLPMGPSETRRRPCPPFRIQTGPTDGSLASECMEMAQISG